MLMTWNDLLADKRVTRHTTSSREIEDLRAVVKRNLMDAALHGISADGKYSHAYDAVLLLSKMAVACSGYRTKGTGAHANTFLAMNLACGSKTRKFADYFDQCRRKRNKLSYDMAGIITEKEAEELLDKAHEFKIFIESWIASNHPEFKPQS